jgi:hypothetical protein
MPRHAKVAQHGIACRVEQHVLKFHVSVEEARGVNVGYAVQDLSAPCHHVGRGHDATQGAAHVLGQAGAQQRHDQVRLSPLVHVSAVHGNNPRVGAHAR